MEPQSFYLSICLAAPYLSYMVFYRFPSSSSEYVSNISFICSRASSIRTKGIFSKITTHSMNRSICYKGNRFDPYIVLGLYNIPYLEIIINPFDYLRSHLNFLSFKLSSLLNSFSVIVLTFLQVFWILQIFLLSYFLFKIMKFFVTH